MRIEKYLILSNEVEFAHFQKKLLAHKPGTSPALQLCTLPKPTSEQNSFSQYYHPSIIGIYLYQLFLEGFATGF